MLTQKGQTYSNPQGGTPQGNDVANTLSMLTNMPSQPQLTQSMGQTAQELAGMQTPQARQGYIQNSDIPAMQNNYEDVARQLYQYDKMYLNPAYSQAPAQPSDAPSFGRVGASNLMQLTPELAQGPNTLYADNPAYAVSSQANQQTGILDVLDNLNKAIGREFDSRRGQYASTVKAKQSLLDTISSLLDKRVAIDEAAKDRAIRLAEKQDALNKEKKDSTLAIWNQIYSNATTEKDIWDAINENDAAWRAAGIDVDSLWNMHADLARKVGMGGLVSQGLKEKKAKLLSGSAEGTVRVNVAALKDFKDVKDALVKAYSGGENGGFLADNSIGGMITGPIARLQGGYGVGKAERQKLSALEAKIKKGVYGSVLSKYELGQAKNWVPSVGTQESVNIQRLNALMDIYKNEIRGTLYAAGMSDADAENYINQALGETGGGGRPPLESFDK